MRFNYHRFSRCRNAHLNPWCAAFNQALDARLISGIRTFQTSIVEAGSEYRPDGFVLGHSAPSRLSLIISEALSSQDDEVGVVDVASLQEALDTLMNQRSWRIAMSSSIVTNSFYGLTLSTTPGTMEQCQADTLVREEQV